MQFMSRHKRLRITFVGARHREVDGNREYIPGIQALFQEGFFDTDDADMIARLQRHPWYGIEFFSEGQKKDEEGNPIPVSIAQPTAQGLMMQNQAHEIAEDLVTACPKCPFKAKNKSGLLLHMKAKHATEE